MTFTTKIARTITIASAASIITLTGPAAHAQTPETDTTAPAPTRWFAPGNFDRQLQFEFALNEIPSTETLRLWHDQMCMEPHPAGTPADQRMIAMLRDAFESLGLETEVHEFSALLSMPVNASLHVIDADGTKLPLSIQEREVVQDADSGHPDLSIGWNAYSGSGTVTAPVVYVNYGTMKDFEQLDALGISCRDAIVLARYGGNFRGHKVKFAEERGAAGVIIFTDPEDSGRGPGYPAGGWANESSIQRGSIKTLAYPGDPRTPGEESLITNRDDHDINGLPTIPVQPIGWGAAEQILRRLDGPEAPADWQGGLDLTYRLTSSTPIVNQMVEQRREVFPLANVVGGVRGSTWPDQMVIIGCHFDAWSFGAGDPHAGSIVLMEMARSFAHAGRDGWQPKRTVLFANWGAEEFGIIGSTEWVEANRDRLADHTVAYINLDMAAMGRNFRSSAAPMLRPIITDVCHAVDALDGTDRTVHQQWSETGGAPLRFGNLGGGSDHVGFYCHLGIPCASLGAGGSEGVSYHSNYDSLTWYRMTVGNDYRPAMMLTHFGNVLAARLANADIVPLDPRAYTEHVDATLATIADRFAQRALVEDGDAEQIELIRHRIDALRQRLERDIAPTLKFVMKRNLFVPPDQIGADSTRTVSAESQAAFNAWLMTIEAGWLSETGLRDRPWYRSTYASTDPTSGYGAIVLPTIIDAERAGDLAEVRTALKELDERLTRLKKSAERFADPMSP
jgi:N-acetylated-alpha-linked acidic dipeptidase